MLNLLALAFIGVASGHGASIDVTAVAIAPDDDSAWWAALSGWGVAATRDAGATWTWTCGEVHGYDYGPYDIVALGGGEAAVATEAGVIVVGADCASRSLSGLPEDFYAVDLAPWQDGVLALGTSELEGDGLWACPASGCVPSDLVGADMYARSAFVDGKRAWMTQVEGATLASSLWTSGDGVAWSQVYAWPDGDTNPRVLLADGDLLLVWRGARDAADIPELLRSTDGGQSFQAVFAEGYYTDPAPGLVRVNAGETLFLGDYYGARTWRSEDDGATWEEVSTWAPSVKCGTWTDTQALACANRLNDGFHLARTQDGVSWEPVACLQDATADACGAETCADAAAAWAGVVASYVEDERCDTVLFEPEPTEPDGGCGRGCAAALVFLPLYGLGAGRGGQSRTRRKPRTGDGVTAPTQSRDATRQPRALSDHEPPRSARSWSWPAVG